MTNYQGITTAIAGSSWARTLRILLAVYELADFCSGYHDIPVPVGGDFREQVEDLFPGPPPFARGGIWSAMGKIRGGLQAGDCAACPTSAP